MTSKSSAVGGRRECTGESSCTSGYAAAEGTALNKRTYGKPRLRRLGPIRLLTHVYNPINGFR